MDVFALSQQHRVQEVLGDTQVVELPLWSTEPALHDRYAGSRGHFLAVLGALKNVQKIGRQVVLHITLCKSNIGTLEKLLHFAWSLQPKEVHLWFPTVEEDVAFVPRLEFLPEMWEGIAPLLGRCTLHNIPLCFLPAGTQEVVTYEGSHMRGCYGCVLQDRCPGVPHNVTTIYGPVEVRPVLQ